MYKLILISLTVLTFGCQYTIGDGVSENQGSFEDIEVESSFDYSTNSEIEFVFPEGHKPHLARLTAITNYDTTIIGEYLLDGSLVIKDLPTGINAIKSVPVNIGLAGDYTFEIQPVSDSNSRSKTAVANSYYALGTWSSNYGVPDYLIESDVISSDLLNDINASLPESRPVPSYNPEYLVENDMNTVLVENADVWVTFVHEGAGYKNSLGYFKYNKGDKPVSVSDIDSLFIIFPNLSFTNSGGDLSSGDKIYLGRFDSSTVISWFLLPNAWVNNSGVNTAVGQIKYAVRDFNDFTDEQFRQHTIVLNDEARELLLLSFEDISRPGGDNDFNDAIFYVTANPYTAVDTEALIPAKKAVDTDGDGLFDHEDSYPEDPERAYSTCYPTCYSYGSLLFEDQWPSKGDYDFNDIVIDYRFTYVYNAQNKVKEVQIKTLLRAAGGLYKSSLLFNLGASSSKVESVQGNTLLYDFIKLNANGTESGLDEAVIPIFDNSREILAPPSGYSVTNVLEDQPHIDSYITTTTVIFSEPIFKSELNTAPHDPFIVTEFNRGTEIHLPGKFPTAKANMSLFGTQHDGSNLNSGFTYKTSLGHPWALDVSNSISYPKENRDFSSAYIRFRDWAESGGTSFKDWHREVTGNVNAVHFYRSW